MKKFATLLLVLALTLTAAGCDKKVWGFGATDTSPTPEVQAALAPAVVLKSNLAPEGLDLNFKLKDGVFTALLTNKLSTTREFITFRVLFFGKDGETVQDLTFHCLWTQKVCKRQSEVKNAETFEVRTLVVQ